MKSRSEIGNLQTVIITLLIVGLLIGTMFFIFESFRDQLDDKPFLVSNETTAFINVTGYTLGRSNAPGASGFAITAARNGTDGTLIDSANYTISSTGVLTNTTEIDWPVVHIDYSYVGGDEAWVALDDTINATQTIPDLLPLIVLIIVIVIVLALVFTLPGIRSPA